MAHADDPVPLGGGSGLVVNGDTLCTLTAIGNDNRGNLIGFTSAHCGGPGAQVGAEGAEASGVLGTMVAGNDALDYAVIQFDPQKVTPLNNVDNFQIDGLGPDPVTGDVACKLGRTTGYSVRRRLGPRPRAGHDRQPGVRSAGRLRGAGHRQQPPGRHDPRRVRRGPADLRRQVHPVAHAGGRDVDQHAAGRHRRQEPARIGIRPRRKRAGSR